MLHDLSGDGFPDGYCRYARCQSNILLATIPRRPSKCSRARYGLSNIGNGAVQGLQVSHLLALPEHSALPSCYGQLQHPQAEIAICFLLDASQVVAAYCRHERSKGEDGLRINYWYLIRPDGGEDLAVIGREIKGSGGHYNYNSVRPSPGFSKQWHYSNLSHAVG